MKNLPMNEETRCTQCGQLPDQHCDGCSGSYCHCDWVEAYHEDRVCSRTSR